jgi:hypothetical protein
MFTVLFVIKPTRCTKFTNLLQIYIIHISLLSVQWINSWWWAEELSETCRVSWQNKFVKLVHLVGFITNKFVTMQHGYMNVKSVEFNPLNAELNPICHLLALLGGATIVVVSRLRVKPLNAELNPICHLLALLGGATIVVVSRLRVKNNISYVTKTHSANRCVNTISATRLDRDSDTTLRVGSENPTHTQNMHGYQEAGSRDIQKIVTRVSPTATLYPACNTPLPPIQLNFTRCRCTHWVLFTPTGNDQIHQGHRHRSPPPQRQGGRIC